MTITKHKRMTDDERDKLGAKLEKDYITGKWSLGRLADKHGTSAGRVRLLLLEMGVKIRTRGGANRKADPERPKLSKKIAKEYKAGASLNELAQVYDLSPTTVRTLATEGGATMRARGGRKAA